MNADQAAALREPFPPSLVGKLPRAGITLDYVGHGAVTSRLLEVDPEWTWEPLAFDESGLPRFTFDASGNPIAFWVRLTVGGVTRLGCGTCKGNQFDAEKVLIGDAIRNAAMRFGVALDLWIKGHAEDDEQFAGTSDVRREDPAIPGLRSSVQAAIDKYVGDPPDEDRAVALKAFFAEHDLPPVKRMNAAQTDVILAHLMSLPVEAPTLPLGKPEPSRPDPSLTEKSPS